MVFNQSKKRILIIDDDPSVSSIFEFILKQVGYDTLTANTKAKSLTYFKRKGQIHLVFLDAEIEKNSGITIFQEIQQLAPNTPVIMMAGKQPSGLELKKAYDSGAIGIVYKPFDIDEIVSILNSIFPQ